MKKENFVIGLIAVGVVAFLIGRMTAPQKGAPIAPTAAPTATAPTQAMTPPPTPVPAAAAPAAAQGAQVAGQAPTPAPTPAPVKPAEAAAAPAQRPAAPTTAGTVAVVESPVKGPAEAKVTIVEISDFQWPFCSRVGPTLKQIEQTYPKDVKIIWKNNPLSFHPNSMPAAMAAMAMHKQGKFWEANEKFFANQQKYGDDFYKQTATELGLDVAQWEKDRNDAALKRQVLNEQQAAVALGQGGTPAFFINGKALSGAQPFDAFKTEIDNEIKAADDLIAKGTPLAKVHEERAKANLGDKFSMYWDTLLGGKPAPRPKAQVDPTVWKVSIDGNEPTKGKPDALVTIAEFSDFQWPFCSRVGPTLKQIEEKFPNDVRIVFKFSPLPFHNRAMPAALAAAAAHKQGKFWEYHDKLFSNQQALEDADLEKYAQEVGLDVAKWKADKDSPETKALVQKDLDQAAEVNARGTPNFFINGRNLRGAQPYESFEDLINEELEKAKKQVAGGTAAADVYKTIIANGKTFEPVDSTAYEMTAEGRPTLGDPKGDVVIYEFSDFQWPYCARVSSPLEDIAKKVPRVKLVQKQFPLSFHQNAMPAAKAALAAFDQGGSEKYFAMANKIFTNQKDLSPDNLRKWAQEIGLDMAKYDAYVASDKAMEIIKKDQEEAQKAGLQGTPTIYINGRKFEPSAGFSPEAFQQIVDKYFPKK